MKGEIADKIRIEHIFECIHEIETSVKGLNFDEFSENHVLRIAVVKWLEIIGEAANRISETTKSKFSTVEWSKMIGLRNIVVHEYFGINYNVIWETATVSLKLLKTELELLNGDHT